MRWFKHFCDSHRGISLNKLLRKHGMSGIGAYWTLVEICAEKLESEEASFEFEPNFLKSALRTNSPRFYKLLASMHQVGLIILVDHVEHSEPYKTCHENIIRLKMPKLLEYKHKDVYRAGVVPSQLPPRVRVRVRIKNLEIEKDSPKPPQVGLSEEQKLEEDGQQVFPGLLKPAPGRSAHDLMSEVKNKNNTALKLRSEEIRHTKKVRDE